MIKFIICEDEKVLAAEYKNEIDKFMMKYDHEYKCRIFSGYNSEFEEIVKDDKDFKIYLLDIKTTEGSGLDAARMIREEYNDWTSLIIIITSYNEYKYDAFGKRLMLVDFINKLDKYKERLQETLVVCMKLFDNRPKALKFVYKNIVNNIDYRDIVFIDKEQDSKRCIIHTKHKEKIPYQGTINNLIEILDERFVKVSRSAIINTDHIDKFDVTNNQIEFKNGEITIYVSKDKKRGLIENVTGAN
jgi:DNA-binding LytR/AlgR family response regulator